MSTDRSQLATLAAARRPIQWPTDVVFVDLETTGLDERTHGLTEVAVIRTDSNLIARPEGTIHLRVDVAASALVCDWSREHTAWGQLGAAAWVASGSKPITTALEIVGRLLDGAALAAQHLPFEARWLERLYKDAPAETSGREWILSRRWQRYAIDTRQLAAPLLAQRRVESTNLRSLCDFVGVDLSKHHDALCDARACHQIARRLLGGVSYARQG